MKIFTGLIQFVQLIGICYVAITALFDGDMITLVVVLVCLVNLWMICRCLSNMRRMADANAQIYRDFAKRLGWEDIVGDLDSVGKGE